MSAGNGFSPSQFDDWPSDTDMCTTDLSYNGSDPISTAQNIFGMGGTLLFLQKGWADLPPYVKQI